MVLQFGLSPAYVLDEMQMYEISALMRYSYYKSKESWEQSRLISYLIAQSNSTKKLKLDDIIKFKWEKENEDEKRPQYIADAMTEEDIDFLERQAEEMKKYLD